MNNRSNKLWTQLFLFCLAMSLFGLIVIMPGKSSAADLDVANPNVTPRAGDQVEENDLVDAYDTDTSAALRTDNVGAAIEIESINFEPPNHNWAFKTFDNSPNYVEIFPTNLDVLPPSIELQNEQLIRVMWAVSGIGDSSDGWPLLAEGNLKPPSGGGGGSVPEFYWASIVEAQEIDLVIYNGLEGVSGGQKIEEEDEVNKGAVTVANLNDTDGDGTIDKDDDEVVVVGATPPGRNEHDLMKLVLKKPADDKGGNATLTLVSGDVKFWSQSTKGTEVVLNNGSKDYAISELPKTLWVEARSVSTDLQDIEIKLEYQGASDTVKATGLWVDHKRAFRVRADDGADNALPDNLDSFLLKGIINNDLDGEPKGTRALNGSRYGIGLLYAKTFTEGKVDTAIGGRILHEFEIKPHGVEDLGVKFDTTRQIEARDGVMPSGDDDFVEPKDLEDKDFPEDQTPTLDNEKPNDDSDPLSGDNLPKNHYIYSYDSPSIDNRAFESRIINVQSAFFVRRENFREWVRITFDGDFGDKNSHDDVYGSRASNKTSWYMLNYFKRDANGEWEYDTDETSYSSPISGNNDTGNGGIDITLLNNADTDGFTALYDLPNQKWTLTSKSGSSVSDTKAGAIPVGTTWTLTIANEITVVITQGNTAFGNIDSFNFSVFKTSSSGGKKNEIKLGTIDVTDGP